MVPDFPSYPPIIKKVITDSFKQLYEEYKKVKDIYDKGTQATNGEWDMTGLEEEEQSLAPDVSSDDNLANKGWYNRQDDNQLTNTYTKMSLAEDDTNVTPEQVKELVKKCKEVIRRLYNPKNISSMDIRNYRLDRLEKQLNILNDLKSLFFLARNCKIIYGSWPGYESWINFIEEQYKVIDILNKGTAATNGEWDMTGL
jgi:hypothetical protein